MLPFILMLYSTLFSAVCCLLNFWIFPVCSLGTIKFDLIFFIISTMTNVLGVTFCKTSWNRKSFLLFVFLLLWQCLPMTSLEIFMDYSSWTLRDLWALLPNTNPSLSTRIKAGHHHTKQLLLNALQAQMITCLLNHKIWQLLMGFRQEANSTITTDTACTIIAFIQVFGGPCQLDWTEDTSQSYPMTFSPLRFPSHIIISESPLDFGQVRGECGSHCRGSALFLFD